MNEFLYASELKKTYVCYGHFYTLDLSNGFAERCRSVLEIVHRDLPREGLGARPADAVVIMMNPGSSRPLEDCAEEVLRFPRRGGGVAPKNLVLTRPDNTQYQVMRIMHERSWRHVRVLNLSDLRNTKSTSFVSQVSQLAMLSRGGTHSIFCPQRREELDAMLVRSPGAPVIAAWGRLEGLKPLARQCLEAIAPIQPVGVQAGDDPVLYAHPSPMRQDHKLLWLSRMLELV